MAFTLHDCLDRPRDAPALVRVLSARLLAASNATAALRDWCEEHRIGAGAIRAVRHRTSAAAPADDGTRDCLCPRTDEPVLHRRVDLARGGLVLARADNWHLPRRLPAAMLRTLEDTDTPFGDVVAPLRPSRRTFFAEFGDTRRRRPGPSELDARQAAEADGFAPDEVLEHKALVLTEDGYPIAVVRERYLSTLVPFAV